MSFPKPSDKVWALYRRHVSTDGYKNFSSLKVIAVYRDLEMAGRHMDYLEQIYETNKSGHDVDSEYYIEEVDFYVGADNTIELTS